MYTTQPEAWQLLRIHDSLKDTITYKVFAAWRGGYLSGDSWRLNSGVTNITKDDEYYYFHGQSGSIYKCLMDVEHYHSGGYYTSTILERMLNLNNPDINVEIVPFETDFLAIKYQ